MEAAYKKGCRFDGWSEHFRFSLWMESFQELGLDPVDYAEKTFTYDEALPWDVIDAGVSKDFLIEEHQRALAGKPTPDCRTSICGKCGVCSSLKVANCLVKGRGR